MTGKMNFARGEVCTLLISTPRAKIGSIHTCGRPQVSDKYRYLVHNFWDKICQQSHQLDQKSTQLSIFILTLLSSTLRFSPDLWGHRLPR